MAPSLATYDRAPSGGFAGQIALPAEGFRVVSRRALGALIAGAPVLRDIDAGTEDGVQAYPAPPAADADGIVLSRATAATATSITTTGLDGALGQGEMYPPRNVTITATSNANFDLTTWIVRGLDENGLPQEEVFVMPDAGNVTLTGNKFFSYVTEVYVPAQSGTGGAYSVGFGAKLGPLDKHFAGVALYDATKPPGAYAEDDSVSVLEEGAIYVQSETAVDPTKPVYVRQVISGNEVRGHYRATVDANDLAQIVRARWIEKTTGAGVAGLRLLSR
jgi:hypothetical protein